jgi:hypothetical protein
MQQGSDVIPRAGKLAFIHPHNFLYLDLYFHSRYQNRRCYLVIDLLKWEGD